MDSVPELGLLVFPQRPIGELVATARRAEELGYSEIWVADEKFYRDPFVTLTAIGQATAQVRLGTGVTEPYARHPALIAMALATLEELCPGRVVVGLGAGGPGFEPMGVVRRRPARALAEAVAILRGLLAGQSVRVAGEVVSFDGPGLNFRPRPLPIYLAARGRRVLETAGAVADGVILAPFASPEAIAYATEVVRRGARNAGRDTPRVIARVDVAIEDDPASARRAARYYVALPLWVSFPDWGYAEALGIEIQAPLRDLLSRRDYRDIATAAAMVPEAAVDHFAIAGTEDEVAARLAGLLPLVDGLIAHPVAPPEGDVDATTERIARVWQRVIASAPPAQSALGEPGKRSVASR